MQRWKVRGMCYLIHDHLLPTFNSENGWQFVVVHGHIAIGFSMALKNSIFYVKKGFKTLLFSMNENSIHQAFITIQNRVITSTKRECFIGTKWKTSP